MITLRFATAADAAIIAEFSRRTFYDTFARYNTEADMSKFMNEQFTPASLMAEVVREGNIFILAFDAAHLAGYAFLRDKKKPEELAGQNTIEIARIYADQSYIGKGIGKSLMQECISIAKDQGKDVIWLGVWEHNHTAIDFYKKWGFEKFSTHEFILGDDRQTDWLMKKYL